MYFPIVTVTVQTINYLLTQLKMIICFNRWHVLWLSAYLSRQFYNKNMKNCNNTLCYYILNCSFSVIHLFIFHFCPIFIAMRHIWDCTVRYRITRLYLRRAIHACNKLKTLCDRKDTQVYIWWCKVTLFISTECLISFAIAIPNNHITEVK